MLAEDRNATYILVAPDVSVDRRVLHLCHRVHRLAPYSLLRIIDDQVEGVALVGMEVAQQLLRLLPQGGLGSSTA
jgi:hypothetical protein